MIVHLSKDIDLIYSEDDNGWYLQDLNLDRVSIVYKSKEESLSAFRDNSIDWD